MHTSLITYLVWIIKVQRLIIFILLAKLTDIFDHSRIPKPDRPVFKRFNQFVVEEKLPILRADIGPEPLDYQRLLAEQLAKNGKPTLPIARRKPFNFEEQSCPRCNAPQDYLYANNGARGQLHCKVCDFKFQDGLAECSKAKTLRCPHCDWRLGIHVRYDDFDVWNCNNDECPYRLKAINQMTPTELADFKLHPTMHKIRYTWRTYNFTLKGVAEESPIQSPVDLSRIQATPEVLGLILTYHINYGLSARQTAAIMYDVHGVKISHQTVHNYEQAVATVVRPFWAHYPYQLSDEIVGDETYVKVKGKRNYIFYFYDAKRKLILSDYITPDRTTQSAVTAINQVLLKMPEIPEHLSFVVDANPIYQVAQIFFAQQGINFDIHQVVGLKNQDKVSRQYRYLKQTIERLNRSYKVNYRSSTGFGSASGSASYTTLFSIAYNFLRPHRALNYRVPVALPELRKYQLMPDKWLRLIELAQMGLPSTAA